MLNHATVPVMMLIQHVLPETVQGLGNLRDCLHSECLAIGFSNQQFNDFVSVFPSNLVGVQCFLDKLTNLWRYEFGLPSDLTKTKKMLWGTPMWPPVNILFQSVRCAKQLLPSDKLQEYMQRLANIDKHQDALVEMFPVLRLAPNIPVCFEVAGEGVGNKTIDWKIGAVPGRCARMDVKNRMSDLYSIMDQNDVTQAPQHDPALLFRSIENKFLESDPENFLQGVWVVTQIKQELIKLQQAFDTLCARKVHFAILGDYRDDAFVLAKREEDLPFIMNQFALSPSERFTFLTPLIRA